MTRYELKTRHEDGTWSYVTSDWDLTTERASDADLAHTLRDWLLDLEETAGEWMLIEYADDGTITRTGGVTLSEVSPQ